MTPVYQTKVSPPDGNCVAACVATILDVPLSDVDVDVASCDSKIGTLINKIESKAGCRIYRLDAASIIDGVVKSSERLCIVEACRDDDPSRPHAVWHAVVCEILDDGKLNLVFNPLQWDQKNHIDKFSATRSAFIVTRNKTPAPAQGQSGL